MIVPDILVPNAAKLDEISLNGRGWKDEYLLLLTTAPLILCFIPDYANYVSLGFAILDACETSIRKSNVPARKVGEHILQKVLSKDEYGFTCSTHEAGICAKAIRIMVNVFFNNQRKHSTDSVVNDRVVPFKKPKRTKASVA